MASDPSRRRILAAIAVLALTAGSGCVTIDPTITTQTGDTAVFESVSTTDPWAGRSITATVKFTPEATTTRGVTRLVVIAEDGSQFDSTDLASGSTKVNVYLPTNQNATLVAVNTVNGTIVETEPVVTGGDKLL